ncbi:MAG: hypothetical protein IKM73_15420 [Acidaminococcaceae bacterium]|nr:hypothetical protein [Acidaminococcaceae bacterium]
MNRTSILKLVVVGILLLVIPISAFSSGDDGKVVSRYQYTRSIKATLSINNNGTATCYGYIKANTVSDISLTVKLYKQSGSSWSLISSWSCSGNMMILDLLKTRAVASGTYKVVVSGSVTSPSGRTEQVTETSAIITY